MRTGRTALALAACLLATPLATAAQPAAPATVGTTAGDVTVLADHLEEVGPEHLLIATGNVEVSKGPTRLMADRVELNRVTGDAVAQGRVVFYDGEDQLVGQRIEYNFKTGTGVVYEAEGRVAPYYRISGEQMTRLGQSVYTVRKGTFTTCEGDPPPWSFHFGDATADLEDVIQGRSASFWVENLPVIPAIPYFAAAIRRDRETGFLFPRWGNSSQKGFFAEIPFFWAIDDSQDLTIALDEFVNRGTGFNGEYRYVISATNQGRLRGFVLDEYELHNDIRALGAFRHDWILAPGLTFKADVNGVSDTTVLRDYSDQLADRTAQRIQSNVFLTKNWSTWNAVADLFEYQDLTTTQPIELDRLPELRVIGVRQPVPGIPRLLYELETSGTNFVRSEGSSGQRFDFHPKLSLPISPGGLFTVTPFAGARVTAYSKTVVGTTTNSSGMLIETTSDTPRVRRLEELGTDLEMTVSRVYSFPYLGYAAVLHTIEPRVRYTWTSGQDTNMLPNWTSSVDNIQTGSLIEYSLTNRIRARAPDQPGLTPTRWELFRLELGSSYDTRRNQVGAPFGTMIVAPNERLRWRTDGTYNVQSGGFDNLSSDVSMVTSRITTAVGARYSDTGHVGFLQGSVIADITRFLTLRLSTNWDVRHDVFIERRVAVDWRFQCWAVTLEYVNTNDFDNQFKFAVNLLGIGAPIQTSVGVGAFDSGTHR